jgi:hypothetical protein
MQLAPFLLEEWIERKFRNTPPIIHDLSLSMGPSWTLGELVALDHISG